MSSSERIKRLHNLVESLSDRDKQLKCDAQLFGDFFQNFPIPVTMWSLDESGNILSKRGNTVIEEEGTCVENMFHGEYSSDFIQAHKDAYAGKLVTFFSNLPEKTYYTRLVPRYSEEKEVVGVTGISWDITSNYVILECLKEIKDLTSADSKVHELAEKALSSSRIRGLLEE